jgi:aspartate-semialdehyde dehydrogenase
MEPAVPLLIPEVNPDQLKLLDIQEKATGWKGRIVTNPNCSTIVVAMALAPLRQFGLKTTMVTTLQAISGAGYPGVASWDILANIIPYIGGGEEEKIETETKKILGCTKDGKVEFHGVTISAQTTRVPVQNGHTGAISVGLEQKPDESAIIDAWNSYRGRPQDLGLPSAPPQPIVYMREANRPQPALDANRDNGMAISVGRLRPCPILDYKFIALGHNTIRGAAGVAILNAELMHADGMLS